MTLYTRMHSPLGSLLVIGTEQHVTGIYIQAQKYHPEPGVRWIRADDRFSEERSQLDQYFAGRRRRFDIAIRPAGTTFQRDVWSALARIPFGTTTTYGEIARRIGRPDAPRAVGAAVGRNPISIVIPCHRVVGADGSLTGFAGGIRNKRLLLNLESGADSVPLLGVGQLVDL